MKMLKGVKRAAQSESASQGDHPMGSLPTIVEITEGVEQDIEQNYTQDNLLTHGQSSVMHTNVELMQPDVVPPLTDLKKLADMQIEQLDTDLKGKNQLLYDGRSHSSELEIVNSADAKTA